MKPALVISDRDNVATALEPIAAGRDLELMGRHVVVAEAIVPGHKFALTAIAEGAAIVKYGSRIGTASSDIAAGAHVRPRGGDVARPADGNGRVDLPLHRLACGRQKIRTQRPRHRHADAPIDRGAVDLHALAHLAQAQHAGDFARQAAGEGVRL